MCGIAGIISFDSAIDASSIRNMANSMAHRGPDGEGFYSFEGVHFAHRRLSIIDPMGGHQPMSNADGSVWLIFNGAIYNYMELRQELIARKHTFTTYSDTEVLLHLYEEFGEECLHRCNGMFAFAILDQRRRRVFMARDRFGIKPCYYALSGKTLLFASEIKALFASGLMPASPNPDGIVDYITFQFTLGKHTMFAGVHKLLPGHCMSVPLDRREMPEQRCWWDVIYSDDTHHTAEYFEDRLMYLISDAVKLHMRADVPVGGFLSGGLDSSTIVMIAADTLSGGEFHTFTGGFAEGPQFDETSYAQAVAHQARTLHHECVITTQDFQKYIEQIIWAMDEPCAGPGILPQYCVAKLASKHVKVAMGGQGGDEVFIGYARYMVAYLEEVLRGGIFETFDKTRHAVSLESIIPNLPLLRQYVPMMRSFWKDGVFDALPHRYFRLVDRSEGVTDLFNPDVFVSSNNPFENFQTVFNKNEQTSYINRMCYFDMKASLPALLQVDDRTSMAFGLESRLPFLDYRIVELCASIPPGIKFAGGTPKALFRKSIQNLLPEVVLSRKDKMGFPVPLSQWYLGELKDFVHDILLSRRAVQRGLYNCSKVEDLLRKKQGFSRIIWGLLCLELWHRQFIDK